MAEYPHLKLPIRIFGSHKSRGGGKGADAQTLANRQNRQGHGKKLQGSIESLRNTWVELRKLKESGERPLPNTVDIPLFLRIDYNALRDIESFRNWGVEIIAEEPDGFIIGVSNDNFKTFEENLNQFLQAKGVYRNAADKIWDISTDDNWRIERLLTGDLKEVWGEIDDNTIYTVEFGVACYSYNPLKYPEESDFDNDEEFQQKLKEFKDAENEAIVQRDIKQIAREEEITSYLKFYGGTQHDEWDNVTDAIFFKVSINGKGLRDIVITYPYLFKISFPALYQVTNDVDPLTFDITATILPPTADSPLVCVIDSGIQENHVLLVAAIDVTNSKSYVEGDASTADYVKLNGHGTKVAGAVLYPNGIPRDGDYQLASRIQNARILDKDNKISTERFGPALLESIAQDFPETRVFNLSVSEERPFTGTHMHELAASIDKISNERDVLFVVSIGNIFLSTGSGVNPGIVEHLSSGRQYPDYLDHSNSKITNPGISLSALTVGSIGHVNHDDDYYRSIAGLDFVSPFSRTGLGIWGSIKPDVVEYGGDLVVNKATNEVKVHQATSQELVHSTMYQGVAFGKDSYGTSFSCPKVSYIVSRLNAEMPNESAQMYRALIVQGARHPWHCFDKPKTIDFKNYGYGIPNLERTLNNTPNRVTFIQKGRIGGKKADLYTLAIPPDIRGEGKDFSILIEVTLAFTSKTRVTRKGAHSYLGTWLEWRTSNIHENFNSFRNSTLQYLESDDEVVEEGGKPFPWILRDNPKHSPGIDINRNNSTVQKSWAIVKPHEFTEDFSIAVIGHVGWDKDLDTLSQYALCVSFECLDANIPVYELLAKAQIPIEQQEIEL